MADLSFRSLSSYSSINSSVNQQNAVSVPKTLARLISIPSNRSCADCRSALIDSSQVHASYSPNVAIEDVKPHVKHHFLRNHTKFAPPNGKSNGTLNRTRVPPLRDLPVDPVITAASQKICGHGVFVCAMCGAAHALLGRKIAIVKAVQDTSAWTVEEVQLLSTAGGNARATTVLEAYVPAHTIRPTATSSIADRLQFIRAKYEALAFSLPPATGPLARMAWENIVEHHPEWKGLWGAELRTLAGLTGLRDLPSVDPGSNSISDERQSAKYLDLISKQTSELPNRLVDYFCVISPSDYLHPSVMKEDLSNVESPEEILLAPEVSDCYPAPDFYDNDEATENSTFPEHVSTFVFPDGCRASTTSLPPSFFSFVLTNSAGERLYGGALCLYDDARDTVETLQHIMASSNYPVSKQPSWLLQTESKSHRRSVSPSSRDSVKSENGGHHEHITRHLSIPASTNSDVMFLPKCLVVLSHHPFFDLWRKFLLQIYRIALTEAPLPIERFIANFVCEVPLPPPGKVQVKFGFTVRETWTIERPPENQLPLANFSYKPLFASLSVTNVLVVIGCLLQEKRVVLLSKYHALLGPTAEALLSLLFPFHWQGMYLPILPYNMLEILDAPVPYLVGLHSRYLTEYSAEKRPRGVVFVDLDRDAVHLGFEDGDNGQENQIPSLPERQAAKLKARLLESATRIYISTNSQAVGTVTTGSDRALEPYERESYAQVSNAEIQALSSIRRKDLFPQCDKAYRDNELLVPISGFLSEQGQLYQRESTTSSNDTPKEKIRRFRFKLNRPKSSPDLTVYTTGSSGSEAHEYLNLLDLNEPPGFSSNQIREAFLKFFVSIFMNYRNFLGPTGFRSSEFVSSLHVSSCCSNFVSSLTQTQMFQGFISERIENQKDPEVLFFDESITAKINRSKMVTLGLGGKKETSFLNDRRSIITETFTPPPPSNWGLPDDGRQYHYGRFPELNHDLFGKIRQPMVWKDERRKRSLRRSRRTRQSSVLWQANERAVVEKASKSLIRKVSKRGVKNLESALKALSTPFSPPKRPNGSENQVPVKYSKKEFSLSEISLPSTFEISEDLKNSAEEMVLNARRKHAILLGIIVQFQAICRRFLVRNQYRKMLKIKIGDLRSFENDDSQIRIETASVQIQKLSRIFLARQWFKKHRSAAIKIQANLRRLPIRLAFLFLMRSISKMQALARGFVVRKQYSQLISERLQHYRQHIFRLWQHSHTPLAYRSKFWSLLVVPNPVRLVLAEHELQRLWAFLQVAIPTCDADASLTQHETLGKASLFGFRCDHHLNCIKTENTPFVQNNTKKRKSTTVHSVTEDRIYAERMQVYDRLSSPSITSPERLAQLFDAFSIPLKDKKKKIALAETLWMTFDEAEQSAELFMELFPELQEQSDIIFKSVSKKSLRRFPVLQSTPLILQRNMCAHQKLHDLIHNSVTEIADIALRKIPVLSSRLDEWKGSKYLQIFDRVFKAYMQRRNLTDENLARRCFLRDRLLNCHSANSTVHPLPVNDEPNEHNLNNLNVAHDRAIDNSPGVNCWQESSSSSAYELIEGNTNNKDKGFPGENFWVRQ